MRGVGRRQRLENLQRRRAEGDAGRKLVGGHERDDPWRQYAHSVQLPAIEQHLAEPRVVGGRGYHPAAARRPTRLVRHIEDRRPHSSHRIGLRLGDASDFRRRDIKAGVGKSERHGDPLGDELIQSRAGNNLDNPTQHVDGHAVIPRRPRLMSKRKLRELGNQFRQRLAGIEKVGRKVSLFDQGVAEDAVGDPRSVSEQILNRHFAPCRLKRQLRIAGGSVGPLHAYLQPLAQADRPKPDQKAESLPLRPTS